MSSRESYTSVINRKAAAKQQLMNVAMDRERADLVLKMLFMSMCSPMNFHRGILQSKTVSLQELGIMMV